MITGALFVAWLRAFAFTQIIEAPIYRRLLGVSWVKALTASALTHPFVWFVFPLLREMGGWSYVQMGIYAELFAWLAEAAFFRAVGHPWKKALVVSLVANATSVLLGLVCRHFFGVP